MPLQATNYQLSNSLRTIQRVAGASPNSPHENHSARSSAVAGITSARWRSSTSAAAATPTRQCAQPLRASRRSCWTRRRALARRPRSTLSPTMPLTAPSRSCTRAPTARSLRCGTSYGAIAALVSRADDGLVVVAAARRRLTSSSTSWSANVNRRRRRRCATCA